MTTTAVPTTTAHAATRPVGTDVVSEARLAALLAPYRGAVLARPRPHSTTLRDRLRAPRLLAALRK